MTQTVPPMDPNNWMEEYLAAQQKQQKEFNEITKPAIFKELSDRHIGTVIIDFDGSGDSGHIDDIKATAGVFDEPGEENLLGDLDDIPLKDIILQHPIKSMQTTLQDLVEEFAYEVIGCHHGGWENNEGAYGYIVLRVPSKVAYLEINHRILTYELTTEEY